MAERTRDLLAVTSVYEARIEDVVVHGRYLDKVDFTVRPTATIWGSVAPDPYRLSFEAGACTNWFFLMDEEAVDERPRDGLKLIVMANPEGLADNSQLLLVRAGGADADIFLRDWRAARAGQPLSRRP
ncbi:MAG: hypothetical protein PSV23_12930 [Brevundimonas sp.]|uniref:hypothetical protein n=1 Tax=Brevundimonas sp. TaxID=1871086 RepID=UPI00248A690C|nr:hypothetical protein [Brevundimonas sp.]MDI1327689.1 hypothetical protein [Brevundimonas sp.]